MTSSPLTKPLLFTEQPHLELICRFLSGEFSLFALQRSLSEPIWPNELHQRLQTLNWRDEQIYLQLESRLKQEITPAQLAHWELLRVLPWMISAEPRACRSVEISRRLQLQGLHFLAPIGEALAVGELPDDPVKVFDWDLVRNVIVELKPAAELILHSLERGEIQITDLGADGEDFTDGDALTLDLGYRISELLRPLLVADEVTGESRADWRGANQKIAAWLEQHQHLHV